MPKRARSHLKKSSCISLACRNAYTDVSIMLQYKVLLAARQSITAYHALCGGPLCKLNVANCAQVRRIVICYWQQQAVVVRRDIPRRTAGLTHDHSDHSVVAAVCITTVVVHLGYFQQCYGTVEGGAVSTSIPR